MHKWQDIILRHRVGWNRLFLSCMDSILKVEPSHDKLSRHYKITDSEPDIYNLIYQIISLSDITFKDLSEESSLFQI